MKLVREEGETEALLAWLAPRAGVPLVSSEVACIEVLRAARRAGPEVLAEARLVVGDLDLIPVDGAVRDLACHVGDPLVRTLDALHLASAVLLLDDLTAFVAYDTRLARAAEAAGLPATAPS